MPNKLCVFIISCNSHKQQWPKFIKNMTDFFDFEDYYIVSADPDLPRDYHIFNKFLIVKANDYYEGLSEKILKLFQVVATDSRFSNYTHFVKMDDTVNISYNFSFKKLEESIEHPYEGYIISPGLNRKYHFNKCKDYSYNIIYKGTYIPYVAGSIYIISIGATKLFLNFSTGDIKDEFYEDLMVGKILYIHSIFPKINRYVKYDSNKSIIYSIV